MKPPYAFATPYGLLGWKRVVSAWGDSVTLPDISDELAWQNLIRPDGTGALLVRPLTMRIASNIRSTPTPLISVTNSACCQDIGTKLTAPRLYASSGWIVSIADTRLAWSSRSPSTNRTSDRCLLTHERRGLAWPRMRPHTWYPSAIRCSARYDPSCPVIPVISARLDMRQPFWLLSARRSRCHGRRRQLSRTN